MNIILAAVVAVLIVIVSTAVISTNVLENIQHTGDYYAYANAKNVMSSLYDAVQSILLDANSSRHFVHVDTGGYFFAKSADGMARFVVQKSSFNESLTKKENNVFIRSGPPAMAYSFDVDNDGKDELVMENDALIFAVEKMGNTTTMPYTTELLNDRFIAMVKNKQTNATLLPVAQLHVDDTSLLNSNSSGYTEMLYHPAAVSSTIHLYVQSPSADVYFTLSGGNDFVEIRVVPR